MISGPQGDLKHTGHVGLDGAYFGDVGFMAEGAGGGGGSGQKVGLGVGVWGEGEVRLGEGWYVGVMKERWIGSGCWVG